jgi:tRNA-Thr(GGU) m(6)t(6)A37 methyltransferase TsaA
MTGETYTVVSIGYVQSTLTDRAAAPKQGREGAPAAWLVFNLEVRDGLCDLQVGDDVLLITWLDRSERDVLLVHPRDDMTQPERGVFSTRSADRPNPIGLHRVRIIARADDLRLQVEPLEALDQTPILDLKPVLEDVPEA